MGLGAALAALILLWLLATLAGGQLRAAGWCSA
jgi:hypothetical protein